MYSMSGDVVELPVGGAVRKKQNLGARQAEMARLSALGDLLGMNQAEVRGVVGEGARGEGEGRGGLLLTVEPATRWRVLRATLTHTDTRARPEQKNAHPPAPP